MPEKSKSKKKVIVGVVLLALVAVVLLLGYYLWQNGGLKDWKLPTLLSDNAYQAIFLTNGQVYFGHAANLNSNYVELRDVYYLQVSQVLQPATSKKTTATPQQSISLAKLGVSELHKPKDEMKINRSQILFIEDLEDSSQVVKAIEDYKATLK